MCIMNLDDFEVVACFAVVPVATSHKIKDKILKYYNNIINKIKLLKTQLHKAWSTLGQNF